MFLLVDCETRNNCDTSSIGQFVNYYSCDSFEINPPEAFTTYIHAGKTTLFLNKNLIKVELS